MEPIQYLSTYLPYAVTVNYEYHMFPSRWQEDQDKLTSYLVSCFMNKQSHYRDYKLLLRPLSKLTEEIEHNGERFIPAYQIFSGSYNKERKVHLETTNGVLDEIWITYSNGQIIDDEHTMTYRDWRCLFEWHFDVFGLIEQGKAVEK